MPNGWQVLAHAKRLASFGPCQTVGNQRSDNQVIGPKLLISIGFTGFIGTE
jgi:hypothetical protein